jgi:hypothetical protein
MGKKYKKSQSNTIQNRQTRKLLLIAVPAIAFIIKMIVMANTAKGGWLGADGENYLTAVDGLRADGFFSEARNLHYWPAGYSIFIWPLTLISLSNFFYFISIIQSLLFAYATYFFTTQITKTKVASLAIAASIVISFNPTLSLGSNVVGYETPAAALLLLSIGLLIKDKLENAAKPSLRLASPSALAIGISCFFQPRNLLFALAIIAIYALSISGRKAQAKFAAISLAVLMIFPIILVSRNMEAIGSATISTNLGTTMFIGVGDEATGGYNGKYNGVPCPAAEKGTDAQIDSAKVKCALLWNLQNPGRAITLVAKKSIFYWSPWFGPDANGTMARNPWLKINPIKNSIKTQQNYDAVYGPLGTLVSWAWILGQIALLFSGLVWLWKMGGTERLLSKLAGAPVLLGWLVSMGTIGDHRFRIPQMGLSLFLQLAGFVFLKRKFAKAL